MNQPAHQIAMRYEGLLREKGARENELRFAIFKAIANEAEFMDVKMLKEKLEKKGFSGDIEKVRYMIKRLSAAGFLEKKPVAKMNKYLFRLQPLEALEKQFSIR